MNDKPASELKTSHRVISANASDMRSIEDSTVACVVTSPPYPMIEMWDGLFSSLNPEIGERLSHLDAWGAFDLMHRELDKVWRECFRVLFPGGFACIDIGDATRSVDGEFCLYPNHARIIEAMRRAGFTPLPDILWRKPTNAPNKFMGSGMLPAGAYVTYEHEYVLILRKGGKRMFSTAEEKSARQQSAFFWEERNTWFSDVWLDLRGTGQDLCDPDARERSAAFPFELPYRLIQMYTLAGDTVLDPFLGTGTTSAAALASARSSIGLELDPALTGAIDAALRAAPAVGSRRIEARLDAHRRFVKEREQAGLPIKHRNLRYDFPVITGQEVELELLWPTGVRQISAGLYEAVHSRECPAEQALRQGELDFIAKP